MEIKGKLRGKLKRKGTKARKRNREGVTSEVEATSNLNKFQI